MRRIVLLGATGYTGRLTLSELATSGAEGVLLLGRRTDALRRAADDAGLTATVEHADVTSASDLAGRFEKSDVVLTCVGPFTELGTTVAEAAAHSGAAYFDTTGEPPFVRWMFEELGDIARAAGSLMVPAFGYDFVPGHVAAADALIRAGEDATGVRIGYFLSRGLPGEPGVARIPTVSEHVRMLTGGTRASLTRVLAEPSFAYRRDLGNSFGLAEQTSASDLLAFDVQGTRRCALSMGGGEHFGLPETFPQLTSVDVGIGWFGRLSSPLRHLVRTLGPLTRTRMARDALAAASRRLPAPNARPTVAARTLVIAQARDADGVVLSETVVEGPEPYELTARLLTWAATHTPDPLTRPTGVHGPLGAFGTPRLLDAATTAGLTRLGRPFPAAI